MKPTRIALFVLSLTAGIASLHAEPADFESAKLITLVKNLNPTANWIGGEDRFWTKVEGAEATRFMIVDAASGRQQDAFDHQAMAKALGEAFGEALDDDGLEAIDAGNLPISALNFGDGSVTVTTAHGVFECTTRQIRCNAIEVLTPSLREVPSPDGATVAVIRDYNIWLRDAATGEERQLTSDGEEAFPYGHLLLFDTGRVDRRRTGGEEPVVAILWSPDGRYLATLREDTRWLEKKSYVTEHLPPDDTFTVAHPDYILTPADRRKPNNELAVFDTETGAKTVAKLDPGRIRDFAPFHFATGVAWWNLAGGELFFVTGDYGGQQYGIDAMDIATGETRNVVEEREDHYYAFSADDYAPPSFYVTSDGAEAIFYSQRSGAGHLYLYDARTGALKNPVTDGVGVVFEIIRVDEGERLVYFTAGGRVAGENPYHTRLYRVSFDGGDIDTLTPEEAVHGFAGSRLGGGGGPSQFSPSGEYLVDVYSTLTEPPVMVIRNRDGEKIADVLEADATELLATGWQPPERFVVKAADGKTDLWGVIVKPTDFDPSLKYAVVDQTYPGPQTDSGPHSFMAGIWNGTTNNAQATAEAGLVVVALDGRGTTRRDRAFRYAFAGSEDAFGSADHRAAIENLGKTRPWLDVTRVGITGASFGGYGSLRAALLHPGFFDVVVSKVGPHEYMHSVISGDFTNERFFGPPGSDRDIMEKASNIAIIDRLEADLMLVYGELDENVPLRSAMTVFDALIKADKDFTSYVAPNGTHGVGGMPYFVKRQRRFFADHLGGPVRQ